MIFENDTHSHSATIHFIQMFDRTLHVSYWYDMGEKENSSFGSVFSVDDLKESSCF